MSTTNRAVQTFLVLPLLTFATAACRNDAHTTAPSRDAVSDGPRVGAPDVAADVSPDEASQREPAVPSATKTGALLFRAQPGWQETTPTSAMRKAEFTLPRTGGDGEDASLVVYYFGPGGGGGKDANLARWAGQFEQPDGSPSIERLESSSRKVAGLDVHDVALSGTYVAETSPGSGVRVRKEGWRMLASILESDHGPYYAKLVGPAATVTHWEPAYRRFVSEVRPGG